jgi:uncharacterized protein YecE (DUF72 family)
VWHAAWLLPQRFVMPTVATQSAADHCPVYVGCAGWSIAKQHSPLFPPGGSHLARYAARYRAVEINSSFYRPHRPSTYARWAACVPQGFSFSVKLPKQITHLQRLVGAGPELARFRDEVSELGEKLGPLLVQLPPSLAFDEQVAAAFFAELRSLFAGRVACEPRHTSWFEAAASALLRRFRIARVAADPAVVAAAAAPGGDDELVYYRLHGSPDMYYSAYSPEQIAALAEALRQHAARSEVWCIFDNTARGAATDNALQLQQLLNDAALAAPATLVFPTS